MNIQENIDTVGISVEGHVLIKDADTNEILYQGRNAIHQENMSAALAQSLAHNAGGFISEMHFGCGAAIISSDGTITYRTPNVAGTNADLHAPTYFTVVDELDFNKQQDSTNSVVVSHVNGTNYADTVVTATLDYEEPHAIDSVYNLFDSTSGRIDPTTLFDGEFEFNEIGLKTKGTLGLNSGKLLTHFIFHPIQKNIEQRIQIIYTLRVRAG